MHLHALPVLYALFVWWFSTGAILYLDGLPRRTFVWSMAGATIVLGVALYGTARSSADASLTGAYCAFTCALLIWGWHEMAFLMGFVTGPRTTPCPPEARGLTHLRHAIAVVAWHELALAFTGVAIWAMTAGQPNQFALWTFAILWAMRISAKINVYLGVLNLTEEFLPAHLKYLASYFSRKPMNLFFPFSTTLSIVAAVVLAQNARGDDFTITGFTFLAMLMALAVLEHWFLVVPIPASALWNWGLRSRETSGRVAVAKAF